MESMPVKRTLSYTMRDVARLAGVSVTTVSSVVNARGGVSPKLTGRVEDAVAALDYHPNEVARSLKVNRTFTIGMIVPDVSNFFFNNVLQGVEPKARQHGYSVVLCDSHEDPEEERDLLRMLMRRRVDGILLASAQADFGENSLSRRHPPIVCFDRQPHGFKGGVVVINNVKASYQATRHLLELGHRRIATVAGPESTLTGYGRLEGYRKALQEAGIPIRAGYIRAGSFSMEGGYHAATEILRLADPPTAIFSANNRMTLGTMCALKDLGLTCPQDVSVCGCDDFDWSELFSPRLTMIVQPSYHMGQVAVDLLLEAIKAPDQQPEAGEVNRVVLDAELRVGESTAPPAGRSGDYQDQRILAKPKSSDSREPAA
jgi:LacI family transcriptional regulator